MDDVDDIVFVLPDLDWAAVAADEGAFAGSLRRLIDGPDRTASVFANYAPPEEG